MTLKEFHQSLQRFSNCQTVDEIRALCDAYCRQLGFNHFVFALRASSQFADAQVVVVDGYPSSWVSHYFEHAFYEVDPVMSYCTGSIFPIVWQDLQVAPSSPAIRMMNEAGDFGLKSGLSMPIHGANGELGVLSFSVDRPSECPNGREMAINALPFLQLLAPYVHEAVRRVSQLNLDKKAQPLSIREQECLRWVADGKSSWEIARILNVSERTINFHLNNAILKLGASSRQHAVVKAVLQRAIRPFPF
jgi:DNA-binding CsgD family transcriptional regulator